MISPTVKLTDVIAPPFYSVHNDIKKHGHTHYWLNGGRGSAKSSFISVEKIKGIMEDPNANAIVYRKVAETLRDSVYEQLLWAIDILQVSHLWKGTLSPLQITYLPTGQKILFRGLDKAKKSKSIKVKKGYFKYIWFEETDEFEGIEEIRTVLQSLMRGGSVFYVFCSYNPPKSPRNWVNAEVLLKRPDRLVHSSNYTQVPREWNGEPFWAEAETLKQTNPEAYQHEYMGEVTGTGREVFTNLTIRRITDEELKTFDRIRRGLDWGFAIDPLHYTECHYDRTRRKLYIFNEIHKVGMSNRSAVAEIKRVNPDNKTVIADSAEPKSIADCKELGLNIKGAKKGPDSVDFGVKWLQDLNEIIIDDQRCPNTAREFYEYEIAQDARGNPKADFPDMDNHSIDAVRYALEDDMASKKVKTIDKSRLGLR